MWIESFSLLLLLPSRVTGWDLGDTGKSKLFSLRSFALFPEERAWLSLLDLLVVGYMGRDKNMPSPRTVYSISALAFFDSSQGNADGSSDSRN